MSGGASIPFLGVGLSYRWDWNAEIMRHAGSIDWLEITPEQFFPLGPDASLRLRLLGRRFPLVGHSLELSVGSDGEDPPGYRSGIRQLIDQVKAPWHGDHLCFTRVDDLPLRALSPLPFDDESVEVASRNARPLAGELGVPFLLENVAYYIDHPESTLDEATFLRRVLEASDCGLLLDLHNLHTNAVNHRFDPVRFLDRLPLDRVVQIHLAGGHAVGGVWLDSHSDCSPAEVWDLFDRVAGRCPVRGVNFEMDSRFPPFARIVEEMDHARSILRRHGVVRP